MSAKKVLGLSAVAFSVVLAVVVGNRMSAEAMAVVIGVVCGVTAGIPMSALALALGRRSRTQAEEGRLGTRLPVVVVAPPALPSAQPAAPAWQGYAPAYPPAAMPAPREFRIIGEDSL